ncbi:MAG: MOSC domain-containing protein [Oceanospirillaceae bacterium]
MKTAKVESLWRYPVKSLIGESLDVLDIDSRGVSGDRVYAISNSEGKFGSGKNTRRFRRIDGLFSLSSNITNNRVSIKFPDGKVLTSKDSAMNAELSQVLGQDVTLTKEVDVSHFDDGAIHIITTSSLSLLHKLLPNSGIDSRRFRPNIVLDYQHLDQDLLGKTINIGGTILEITHKTERCRMITIDQPGIDNRPEILKSVSKSFGLDFGVYAKVISTGSISIGDTVEFVGK